MTSSVAHPGMLSGEVRDIETDSVVRLVRAHAHVRPDAVAVRSGDTSWTYRRLWHRALVVAAVLREAGVGPGDRVAVWADRTAGVIAAALGVMSLRAAYVPLDPTHPAERVGTVLAGARPTALVHDGPVATDRLPALDVPVIDVAELADVRTPPEHELPRGEDIAYVVFTSGSTGTPKGVMVPHASLANYAAWCGSLVGAGGSGSPLFASLGYDLAMTSLWVPLAGGARVVTVPGLWDQATLFGAGADPYTFIKLTPSHARFFEALAEPPRYDRTTRLLMFGGEALDPALITALGSRLDGVRLVNHYGPTETTIGCCAHRFDNTALPGTPTVPIGTPAWNTRAYVVDEQLRPLPPGRPGELVIAGRAVAAGYLGGTGAGDRFVDERELGGAPGPAYRTGDMAELLPERLLLHLGRRDDQWKVNGYRVELGELRHHVLAVPGVADAAFDVVRGPVDGLELFVRATDPARTDGEALAGTLRRALSGALPSGLVPHEVHVVREIVFNSNGKCDVAATRRQSKRPAR
ncbi:amino acid adenylation domain-containing protein [Streptomyces sp. TRM76323]|uniref:Amino acid adenylation domain-containing protein n=1 Tax=Streptomyces tamarix TaxID=3078565 RepID=A0ABU3QR67_9ACTN|nr:amino acid adenylation domain-containing protein [Streptomyces tamarix]MDT9684964.1 amino acid adenylation domain-containing protein [Streptomyces tamarix]